MADEKRKKKRWHGIVSSQEFNHAPIGETLVEDPQTLLGRNITVSLMTLTNDHKKQNISVVFKISEIKEGVAQTTLVGYKISKSYVRRVVRKAVNKIDIAFTVQSKDNIAYTLKPLIVTRYKCHNSVLTTIQKHIRSYFTEEFKNIESKHVFSTVMSNSLQKNLRSALKKIYPIGISEIRVLERN